MAGPLAKLKVLDFTTLLPGPFASMILADLGASVLRVEAPGRPDMVREMKQRAGSVSAAHATVNRSKRCISLDLKNPKHSGWLNSFWKIMIFCWSSFAQV